jgi:predicted permease
MLNFNWKFLTPLALITLMLTAVMDKLLSNLSSISYSVIMLVVNIVLIWVVLLVLNKHASVERQKVGQPRPTANADGVLAPLSSEPNNSQEAAEATSSA